MTREQQEALEALAEKYGQFGDYSGGSEQDISVASFQAGFKTAQSPEVLMLNPLVKGLVEALNNIHIHNACSALTNGKREKFNSFEDGWFGIAEYAGKALAPFKGVEK